MIAAIGFLFLISWSIHTSQKNDANIWCTTPNATVTKESNAPSSTVQGAPILFRTIMAAVDAAPGDNEWPFCILIQKGVYKERIVIERNKRNLVLVGEGINKTIISSNGAVLSTDRYISELATICKFFNFNFIYFFSFRFILCKLFHVKVVLWLKKILLQKTFISYLFFVF